MDRDNSTGPSEAVVHTVSVSSDSELVSAILGSDEVQRRDAISEFRRRIEQEKFSFEEAMPTSQRDRLVPILIEEIDPAGQNDSWWVLISLQGACLKPNKEEWRDWWANSKSAVFWTYPQKKNQ